MSTNNPVVILNKGAPVPKFAMAAMVILLASVVTMVMYMRSKPSSSQVTVPGKELVVGIGDATLYVPKDTAVLAGAISISSLESNLYPVAGEELEWIRPQVVNIQYLNSDGVPYLNVVFSKPALICFTIKERWQSYIKYPDEYRVQYYAEKQNPPGWVTLPMSANPAQYQLCGQTDHLSIFALAVKPQNEIPLTGGDGSTSTPASTDLLSPVSGQTPYKFPTPGNNQPTPASTQAALTATSVALTATEIPPTATNVPPTATNVPSTATVAPPTATEVSLPTATDVPTVALTDAPTDVPTVAPTDPPTAEPPPTDPPPVPTDPPPVPTDPPPVPTDPPPAPTDPPAATQPPVTGFQPSFQLSFQQLALQLGFQWNFQ
jgi:hypothetical protein